MPKMCKTPFKPVLNLYADKLVVKFNIPLIPIAGKAC